MSIAARLYGGEVDLPLIAELANAAPEKTPHRVDLPWRLSSPALENPRNVRLWQSADGDLLGFAAWQVYWAALDYFVRPGLWQPDVEDAIFDWAGERFRELDRERGHPLPYWVEARDDDVERLEAFMRHGYTKDNEEDYSVLLTLRLGDTLPAPELPAGFTIRPLEGAAEVDAYVALHRAAFQSTSMTAPWRLRTLRMPGYHTELDLVAVAPDGTFAGFCVCWLTSDGRSAQIEPMGVHPQFRRLGLSRALQRAAFRQMRELGAHLALVEPWALDIPANQAYAEAGFRHAFRVIRKSRWM